MNNNRRIKKYSIWPKILLCIIGLLLLALAAYVYYVVVTYDRIEDNQPLDINSSAKANAKPLKTGKEYEIASYNIGFGAYTPDFTFFMDGGRESVAESKGSVKKMTDGAGQVLKKTDPDFIIFEEVDLNSTRSHHVNQYDQLTKMFPDYFHHFAINYDSAFLMAPPWKPIGKSLSGIALYSKYPVTSALRRSFPVASGFNKFLDLDRCYSVSRLPTANGKELCIYSVHMSAYGNDANVREGQIEMLINDMQSEYRSGNYVVCGGDFNHDMRNTASNSNNSESWAHPFPRKALPNEFSITMDHLSESEKKSMPESTRNTDIPYDPEKSYMVTVDGFIISDNVAQLRYEVMDAQFQYSDHNPVLLTFKLKD